MSAPATASTSSESRATRRWRVLFVLYALALTTGTHWPKLRIETEIPSADKIIHFLAFGGLTWLLWKTRWLPWLWLTGLLVACWVVLDELTQGIPGLGRTVSAVDIMAGLAGVSVVASFLWYFLPIGGVAERMRIRCMNCILARARSVLEIRKGIRRRVLFWSILCPLLFVPAAILGIMDALERHSNSSATAPPSPQEFSDSVAALIVTHSIRFAAFMGVWALIGYFIARSRARIWALRKHSDELIRGHPCFACGASCERCDFDNTGWGKCDACGERIHRGQWIAPPILIRRIKLPRGILIPIVMFQWIWIAVGVIGVIVVPWKMKILVVIAWFTLLPLYVGFAARLTRANLAKVFDRQHLECRECGYDLHATPVQRGIGTCPECGTAFARILEEEMPAPGRTAQQHDTAANASPGRVSQP